MRILMWPFSPCTRRITSTWSSSSVSGMKSITVATPSSVSKVVSRIAVPGR
jgi:hypothetical protein